MIDSKKLIRAAREPARVFARRDFDATEAGPLWHYSYNGTDYWSPRYPTWLIIDGDCPVLERALKRYGSNEAPVSGRWLETAARWFGEPLEASVSLAGPDIWTLRNGVSAPFYEVVTDGCTDAAFSGYLVAATPVAYCLRRFGENLAYRYAGDVLRVIHDGRVVCIIRTHNSADLVLADAA